VAHGKSDILRANSRIKCCRLCKLCQGEKSFPGYLLNISLRGAEFSSRHALAMNSSITISVPIPEVEESILLEGTIVRVEGDTSDWHKDVYRCGVRLHSLPANFLILLKAQLAR
jgi:hypothetical protein